MDKLTPLELERIRIRRAFRGYDRKAVDRILQRARDEIESLIVENEQIKVVQRETDKRLTSFEEQEALLRDSIVMAQKAAEDARAAASKEAELMIEAARQEASRKHQIAFSEREDLLKEIERIGKERDELLAKMRGLLAEFESRIDSIENTGRRAHSDLVAPASAVVDISAHEPYADEEEDEQESQHSMARETGT